MKKRIITLALVALLAFSALPFAAAAGFTDVPSTNPHATAINYCADMGFVFGYSPTTFVPDGDITREQFAVVWGRTFGIRTPKFNDVTKPASDMDNAIIFMYAMGFMNGVSDTWFSRTAPVTREQAAAIVQRTYLPGVDGGDAYKAYSDSNSISDWAQNAVSVCLNYGIFDGVFDNTAPAFNPALSITRGEVCHLIYNLMQVEYDITVAPMTGGTVTASAAKARAGETVTLTVTPDSGMQLVDGSLQYNGTPVTGTTFTMPAEDVVITADFEAIPPVSPSPSTTAPAVTLASIAVAAPPDKIDYAVGDPLDLTGMIVTATYSDGSTANVTGFITTDPSDGAALDTAGTTTVTITYTEDSVTETTTQDVAVGSPPPV